MKTLPIAPSAQIQHPCVPNRLKKSSSSRLGLLSLFAALTLSPVWSEAAPQPTAGTTVSIVVPLKAPPLISKTTLMATPTPAKAGTPVTISAQVTANAGTVTGTVTFADGAHVFATVPVASGKAAAVMSSPSTGTHALTATFSGSGKLPGSAASLSLVVAGPVATSTSLVAQPASAMTGSPITLTGTVTAASGQASGTVTFLDGSVVLGSQPVNSAGKAQLSLTTLKQGTHSIRASYGGAAALAASVSSPIAVSITPRPSAPTIQCSGAPSSVNAGDLAMISAVASSPSGRSVSVSFTSTEGELTAKGSTATLNTSGIQAGNVQVTCKATDDLGQTASAVASIWVNGGNGEQALTAYSFTDSIGVNIHLHSGETPVVQNFPGFFKAIVALGVHHYRNGIDPYAGPFEYQSAETLAAAGIKADWLIDGHDSPDNINAIYANAPNSIESFEGPNEDDVDAGPVLSTFTQMLYATVRSNSKTAKIPIYAPTLTDLGKIATQATFGSAVDFGNMHDYYYPRYPETPAYGGSFFNCGAYGTMAFNICVSRFLAPGKPVVSTETGFVSGTQSDEVLGRYITRTLFLHLGMGVMRTYLYEFVDDSAQPGYGLMRSDFTPRPAYTAIQNLVKLFGDISYGTPGKLQYTLTGSISNVQHVLFQKSDGTYMMAIWLGVRSANEVAPYENLSVPAQTVSISTSTPVGAVTIDALDDEGNISSELGATSGAGTPVTVTDRITIVSFAASH